MRVGITRPPDWTNSVSILDARRTHRRIDDRRHRRRVVYLYTIILYLYTNSNRNRFFVGQILGIHFPCLPADVDAVLLVLAWGVGVECVRRACVFDNLIINIGREECVPENMCSSLCVGR